MDDGFPTRTACCRAGIALIAGLAAAPAPGQAVTSPDYPIHSHMIPLASAAASEDQPAIDIAGVYTFDLWQNARGGRARGFRYLDNLDLTLTVDGERALGWGGATIFLYALYNNGRSLSGDLVGDLQTVSNIDAGSQALRLYEAWIEQKLAGDRLSLKLGLLDLNGEFDTNDSTALFINSSHGVGPDFSQSGLNGPSIFPVTSLALRAEYTLSKHWLMRAAAFDGVPGDPAHPRRTVVKLSSRDGALLVGELEYRDDRTKAAIGGWHYTATFEDPLASAVAGSPIRRGGNRGVYAFVDRKLTRDEGPRGLSGWIRLGIADQKANLLGAYLGGGFVYTGIVAARAEDKLGIAFTSAELGQRGRRALALAGAASDAREVNFELTYRAPLSKWLTVQPDLQYVINPGADPALRDALVLGLRVEAGF